ncbi:LamG-like jellyroll fold domain-containing protein [Maribellus sediminis]|uniref:LamG-like jellyroll fold domain-containing protein n=1 Tax=Maribellus sediminis TaxID=2696285 RepID=UPI00143072EC|nr:LamG-like jellyroll fold domain-containing protein [Maribellus sediminis]
MKTYFKIIFLALMVILINACDQNYIDSISKVDPGPDESAPQVTLIYPTNGTEISLPEVISSVNIKFEVSDDIEIGTVKVLYDGTEIASYSEFNDYRRLIIDTLMYDNVGYGEHTVSVVATDLDNKSTTVEVDFEKVPPYVPKYPGEVLYMPFEGDFMNMVSFEVPTVVGNPGFSNEALGGLKSYMGAPNSYLTFSGEEFQSDEISAIFWMKVRLSDPAPSYGQRAGILVMGPEDPEHPDAPNNRKNGFRFFREPGGGLMQFKLNAGNGEADTWFDGGADARIDPSIEEWRHFAFTISQTEAKVYIDGQMVKEGAFSGIDWTGCDILSIMSGAPRFTGWNHWSDESLLDELRIFDRALTQDEIQSIITEESGKDFTYTPKYEGEIFYMPFEETFLEYVSQTQPTVTGTPGYADGKVGKAYAGAPESYLTFPSDALQNNLLSAAFWMKIRLTDPEPTYGQRAGILVMGPPDTENENYPDVQNNRKSGFRFFREPGGGLMQFKLNAGNGTADTWVDGGEAARLDPAVEEWHHFAFSISGKECLVYIDGEVVKQSDFTGIDWTGCDILTIMSGDPRFTGWNHWSDESLLDELRFFNKVLTQADIQQIIADES